MDPEEVSDSADPLVFPPDREIVYPSNQTRVIPRCRIPRRCSCFPSFWKFDQKFSAFKHDLDKKEALAQSQLKKIKTETKASNSFKFKGN